jgi:hypothetical protein
MSWVSPKAADKETWEVASIEGVDENPESPMATTYPEV